MTLGEMKALLDEEMTYAVKRRFGRERNASIRGQPGTVLAILTPGRKGQGAERLGGPPFEVEELDSTFVALAIGEIDQMRRQIVACWNPPAGPLDA